MNKMKVAILETDDWATVIADGKVVIDGRDRVPNCYRLGTAVGVEILHQEHVEQDEDFDDVWEPKLHFFKEKYLKLTKPEPKPKQDVYLVWTDEPSNNWRPSLQGVFATHDLATQWIDKYKKSDRYYKNIIVYIDVERVVNS